MASRGWKGLKGVWHSWDPYRMEYIQKHTGNRLMSETVLVSILPNKTFLRSSLRSTSCSQSNTLISINITCVFFLGRDSPQWALASSFMRFLDHTQQHTTVGRTPLEEWSARRRKFYLKTHNTHNRQTDMFPVGFEPTISAGERPQTDALDRAATGTGTCASLLAINSCDLTVTRSKCYCSSRLSATNFSNNTGNYVHISLCSNDSASLISK